MLRRLRCLRSQPQTPTLPRNDVYNTPALNAPTLALDYVAVDPRLDVVLEVRKRSETEIEESLAIALSYGAREEKSEEALLVAWVRTAKTKHGPGLSQARINYIVGVAGGPRECSGCDALRCE